MTDSLKIKPGKMIEIIEARRLQKIAQLKAKLQKEEALLNNSRRKERNSQLVALGVLVELLYKKGDEAARIQWRDRAEKILKDRNLTRVIDAFNRLEKE